MSLLKESVDRETQYLVYGFIHETEKLYKLDNIPNIIIELCVAFFHYIDEIFSIYNPQSIQLSEDKKTITQIEFNRDDCNFGINQITSADNECKYEWDLNIIKMDFNSRMQRVIYIGISSLTQMNQSKKLSGYNYLYQNWTTMTGGTSSTVSWIERKRKWNLNEQYGEMYETGDKVTICLDFEKKQLSFKLNDIDQGVAFDDIKVGPNIKYRLIVKLCDVGSSVSIDGFRKL